MENSILISTKKILGVGSDFEVFDDDIITHINATFSIVNQLGIGPTDGFAIEDVNDVWADLALPLNQLSLLRSYVFLRVKMLFDPPTTSYLINATKEQLEEFETRLSYLREDTIELPPDDNDEALREQIFEEVLHETWG